MSFIENVSMCIYILYPIRLAIAHERLWLRGGLGGKDEYLALAREYLGKPANPVRKSGAQMK